MADEDVAHIAIMQSLEGFNQSFFDSYLELAPDGEYLDVENAEAPPDEYLAVEPDWLEDQASKLVKQAWFRNKGFGRAQAEAELANKPQGSFLVRVSSQPGNYAISVVRPTKIDHMLILPSYAGASSTAPGKTQYRIGTFSSDLFNTIPKLIAYYIAHPYFENERLVGLVEPEEQDGGLYFDIAPM